MAVSFVICFAITRSSHLSRPHLISTLHTPPSQSALHKPGRHSSNRQPLAHRRVTDLHRLLARVSIAFRMTQTAILSYAPFSHAHHVLHRVTFVGVYSETYLSCLKSSMPFITFYFIHLQLSLLTIPIPPPPSSNSRTSPPPFPQPPTRHSTRLGANHQASASLTLKKEDENAGVNLSKLPTRNLRGRRDTGLATSAKVCLCLTLLSRVYSSLTPPL